jgi:hypothetical protein
MSYSRKVKEKDWIAAYSKVYGCVSSVHPFPDEAEHLNFSAHVM